MLRFFQTVLILLLAAAGVHAASSSWVYYDSPGHLAYQTWGNGNHIMDFSSAGYMGGGVAIPTNVATVVTVNPSGGDDTTAIQNAINTAAAHLPVNGFRGAVQLSAGTFYVSSQLNINASGVVVRGTGSTNGTTIVMTNASSFLLFNIAGSGSPSQSGTVNITDAYVSSGTNGFNVSSAAGFSVGDDVMVRRTVTTNWIHYVGMDTLVRSGVTQTWISAGTVITTDRKIAGISGNKITLDAPVTDSFDTNYLGIPAGGLAHYTFSGRISQVGLEHLRIQAPPTTDTYSAVSMNNIMDSWVRDVTIQDGENCFSISKQAKRVTVDDVVVSHSVVQTASAAPADFACTGTQILFNKCACYGTGSWSFVTHTVGTGPIVILNFYTTQDHGGITPHERWCTGVLGDNVTAPNARSGNSEQGVAYGNRHTDGSGHGWTTGWSVGWNVVAPYVLADAAPGTENWAIGGTGAQGSSSDPHGIYDQLGSIVMPRSLYLEQLRERLGGQAVENIGYPLFTISATPLTQSVLPGTNTSFTVNVGDPTLMSNIVALSVSGLPANSSASFNTNSVAGAGSATLTFTASNSIAPGSYTLNIIGANAGLTHTTQVSVAIGNFSLAASPPSQTVSPGNSAVYTISVATNTGFSGTVSFDLSGLPANTGASFNPASLSASGNSTLTVTTSNATPGGTYILTVDGINGGQTNFATVTLIVGHSAANLVWNSTGSGAWDVTNSANWFNPVLGGSAQFYNGDSVLFDDTPGVTTGVTIAGGTTVSPSAITNNSSANNFTISGSGAIGGSARLVKLGTSTLTLNTANSFTGGVMIGGGILTVGNASALGATSGGTVVTNDGTLDLNGLNLTAEPVTASGSGAGSSGAIVNRGADQTTALRTVTLAGDTMFGGTGRWDIRNSGGTASLNTTPSGSVFNITKVGPNQVSLVGVAPIDSALGDIDVQQGTFAIQTSTTQLGDPNKTITIHNGAVLDLWTLTSSPLNKKLVLEDGATVFDEKGPSIIVGPVTLNGTAIIDTTNYGSPPNLTMTNVIAGSGGLNVVGGGNLILSGVNTYNGNTTVSSGALILTNNGSIFGSAVLAVNSGGTLDAGQRSDGTLTVASGQTLTGNGVVNGDTVINSGATLSPGGALTALTFNNNLTLNGGSVTRMELNKTLSTNDSAQVAGALTYGGTLMLTNLSGTLTNGDSFKLFNAGIYSGAFTNIVPAIPAVNEAWNTNNLGSGILSIVSKPTPSPGFVSIASGGNKFIFTGTNGVPGWPFYVLSSTNVAMPLTNWTFVSTNVFDANGHFNFTNTPGPNAPQTFYRLMLQ